jgi:glycosyltransferase involved in cell wall biosynthesis
VFVVPHGVDHDRFRPDDAGLDAEIRHRLGVRTPYLLFVGTIEPRKAVPVLLAAFDRVAPDRPALSLVLAGRPGWGVADVDRSLAQLRSRDRVVRLGYVPDEAVPALLRGAAAAVYPAIEEGFGLPALEAMACGTPLVTTAGTAMAELANDAAALVAPGDVDQLTEAIVEVLDGGAVVEGRVRRGLLAAGEYTWSASAVGHIRAYRWAASRSTRVLPGEPGGGPKPNA